MLVSFYLTWQHYSTCCIMSFVTRDDVFGVITIWAWKDSLSFKLEVWTIKHVMYSKNIELHHESWQRYLLWRIRFLGQHQISSIDSTDNLDNVFITHDQPVLYSVFPTAACLHAFSYYMTQATVGYAPSSISPWFIGEETTTLQSPS